jgi:hypothetical protein
MLKIPGSKLYRAYCDRCGTAIRVCDEGIGGLCERCDPHPPPPRHTHLTRRQRIGMKKIMLQDWEENYFPFSR